MIRALSCLLCLACLGPLVAADSSIGILYIERVFEESTAINDVRKQLHAQADKVKGNIQQMSDEIDATQAELETLPAGRPARFAVADKLEVLRLRRKLYAERHQELLRQVEVDLLKSAYTRLREHLATFAEERGISAVLLGSRDQLGASNLQELNLELATHSVLYHAPYLDISDDFLTYLEQNLDLSPETIESPAPGPGEDGQ